SKRDWSSDVCSSDLETPDPTPTPTDEPTDEPTDPSGDCEAEHTVTNQWRDGFQAEVVVTAGTDLDGWTVTWSYTGDETVDQAWNANVTQNGIQVSATDVEHNGTLSSGESTTFGLIGSGEPADILEMSCTA